MLFPGEHGAGHISFYGHLVNFSASPLVLRSLRVSHWQCETRQMPPQSNVLQAHGSVDGGQVGSFSFEFALGAEGMRSLRDAVQPAPSSRSTPGNKLAVFGEWEGQWCGRQVSAQCELRFQAVQMNFPP